MKRILRHSGVIAAFLLQVALLAWIVADRALLLARGQEIRLQVVPVDPHDLFRGDYVVLSYAISRLQTDKLAGDDDFNAGDAIYVSLARTGDEWQPTALHRAPRGEGVVLKGHVDTTESGNDSCVPPCYAYRVNYGLEEFYVPEGEGRALETLRNDQHISVDVAVAASGRSALKRLLVDGQVRYEEPKL
jgi:uncharacterized membrane-anchored protein